MKNFSKELREHATKIINHEKREMIPYHLIESKKFVICVKENLKMKNDKNAFKIYNKVKEHCHYIGKYIEAAHSICNLRYKIQKEISVEIYNGSRYDYNFIIKELAKDFKGQCECLGENTEKYITFCVLIGK